MTDIPLMTHALPLTNVMRPDRVRESLPQQAVLAGAPTSRMSVSVFPGS